MAFTLAVGMALGSLISLITFYFVMNQSIKNENSIDGKYQIEVKKGANYASADVILTKKKK